MDMRGWACGDWERRLFPAHRASSRLLLILLGVPTIAMLVLPAASVGWFVALMILLMASIPMIVVAVLDWSRRSPPPSNVAARALRCMARLAFVVVGAALVLVLAGRFARLLGSGRLLTGTWQLTVMLAAMAAVAVAFMRLPFTHRPSSSGQPVPNSSRTDPASGPVLTDRTKGR